MNIDTVPVASGRSSDVYTDFPYVLRTAEVNYYPVELVDVVGPISSSVAVYKSRTGMANF